MGPFKQNQTKVHIDKETVTQRLGSCSESHSFCAKELGLCVHSRAVGTGHNTYNITDMVQNSTCYTYIHTVN